MSKFDERKIYETIAEHLCIGLEEVESGLEKTLMDLEADSLDVTEIAIKLEENCGINFDDGEFAEKYEKPTIKNIVNYVREKVEEKKDG